MMNTTKLVHAWGIGGLPVFRSPGSIGCQTGSRSLVLWRGFRFCCPRFQANSAHPRAAGPARGITLGYAKCIGRIGALAVALGIGVGLAARPWAAYAKPPDSGLCWWSRSR